MASTADTGMGGDRNTCSPLGMRRSPKNFLLAFRHLVFAQGPKRLVVRSKFAYEASADAVLITDFYAPDKKVRNLLNRSLPHPVRVRLLDIEAHAVDDVH